MTDHQDGPFELPKIFSPNDVARHLGWSPRKVREKAREIGACHVLGNRMIMTAADIEKLLEATKPNPTPRKEIPVAVQRRLLFGSGGKAAAAAGDGNLEKARAKLKALKGSKPNK